MGLKHENIMGIITLALLNALLFLLNVLDVQYVWLQKAYTVGNINYASLVHKGTGFLIASIILSMLVLIFIFRGNLNFFKQSKTLKYLAIVWIMQNLFMVMSVFMRDWYYIQNNGLTYKRIGVIVYLCMTAFGLMSMLFKIIKTKSLYFLLRVNSWFALFMLLLMSAFNWDYMIADYNISNRNNMEIDDSYLLSLGNAALPLLYENENTFTQNSFTKQILQYKADQFVKKYYSHPWPSWDYQSFKTAQYFSGNKQMN